MYNMDNLKNSWVFWDYKNIDLENELWLKIYLTRVIQFWCFEKKDLKNIKKYYKDLKISDYWKNYFSFYFEKYGVN